MALSACLLMIGALILLMAALWPAPRLIQSLQMAVPGAADGENPLNISIVWQQPGFLRPGEGGSVSLTLTASQPPQAAAPEILLSASLHTPWLAAGQKGTWSQPWRGDAPAAFAWRVRAASDQPAPAQILLESRPLGDGGDPGEVRPVWAKAWVMLPRRLLGLSQAQAIGAGAGIFLIASLLLTASERRRTVYQPARERIIDD
jgi:hypothetical protein